MTKHIKHSLNQQAGGSSRASLPSAHLSPSHSSLHLSPCEAIRLCSDPQTLLTFRRRQQTSTQGKLGNALSAFWKLKIQVCFYSEKKCQDVLALCLILTLCLIVLRGSANKRTTQYSLHDHSNGYNLESLKLDYLSSFLQRLFFHFKIFSAFPAQFKVEFGLLFSLFWNLKEKYLPCIKRKVSM